MTVTRIACAGWSISREAAPQFGGPGSHLERYARVLSAAEINSSFYRPHQPQTYQRWADSVPDDFRFSVKLPRSITHERRLEDSTDLIDAFAAQANTLGSKLGCILVQLPPSLKLDAEAAERLWLQLRKRFNCMLACEARHGSWFTDEASTLLSRHGVTRVIADPPAGKPGPYTPTTETLYIRLHGSPRIYASLYSDEQLRQVAQLMAGKPGWCVFDNTMSGQQTLQALKLAGLLAEDALAAG
ncbi:DUF72 domain-containing protein [Duganella sp. sic0402]|uniref:DUF72 domain-containing protein n=1 Tax=Duganella sp. sic0402 TaxID=2854786 RepID=UPI001C442660|nr:DUF72 domain-containing protein [Duganella sp. sic0402]MBV7536804.1 DUF72 domain-containing protein [Duganella sp. sic0402]